MLHCIQVGHRPNASTRIATSRNKIFLEWVKAERQNGRLVSAELRAFERSQVDEIHMKVGRAANELSARLVQTHARDCHCERGYDAEKFAILEVVPLYVVLVVGHIDFTVSIRQSRTFVADLSCIIKINT